MSDSECNLALVGHRKRLNWSLMKKLGGAEDRRFKHGVIFRWTLLRLLAKQRVEAMIAVQNKYYAPRQSFTRSKQTAATPRESARRWIQV